MFPGALHKRLGLVATVTAITGSLVGCGGGSKSGANAAGGTPTPAPPMGDSSGIDICNSRGAAFVQPTGSANVRLVAGYASTAGAVAQWQEGGRFGSGAHATRSLFRDYPSNEPVAVCYFDGDFTMYGRY